MKYVIIGFIMMSSLWATSNIPDKELLRESLVTISAITDENTTVQGVQTIAGVDECSKNIYYIIGDVTGTNDDGEGLDKVTCEVWDDGILKDSMTLEIQVGETQTAFFQLEFEGVYKTGAAGVGIYCQEIGINEDPFIPKDVLGKCDAKEFNKVVVIPL